MTVNATPVFTSCGCHDPELEVLRDLVTSGMDQHSASRIAFSGHPADDAPPAVWKVWCRLEAHRLASDVRRRLGLPITNRVQRLVNR